MIKFRISVADGNFLDVDTVAVLYTLRLLFQKAQGLCSTANSAISWQERATHTVKSIF